MNNHFLPNSGRVVVHPHFSLGLPTFSPRCSIYAWATKCVTNVGQPPSFPSKKKKKVDTVWQIMTSCHIQTCWELHQGGCCSNSSGCAKSLKLCSQRQSHKCGFLSVCDLIPHFCFSWRYEQQESNFFRTSSTGPVWLVGFFQYLHLSKRIFFFFYKDQK